MPLKIKRLIILIVVIATASLGTNGYLAYQWHSDHAALKANLSRTQNDLTTTKQKNTKLNQENQTYQTNLTQKDQELNDKIAQLAKEQSQLDDLSKQLDDKKKQLDTESKQLTDAQKQLSDTQKQLSDQKSQLAASSSELSKLRDRPPLFSFKVNSTSIANIDQKKQDVQQVVSAAYDTIQSIYGKPYLLSSVTITFVDHFANDNANGEIVITNSDQGLSLDIHIKDFDKNNFNDVNTVIHEVIHSFHGLAGLQPTAFEEGITVAATDAVMKKMIAAGNIPSFSPLYIRISDAQYQKDQSTLSIPRDDSAFYGSSQVSEFYQDEGKAWYTLYQADPNFFSKFNEVIYNEKHAGQEITEQRVLDAIKQVEPGASLSGAAWNLN